MKYFNFLYKARLVYPVKFVCMWILQDTPPQYVSPSVLLKLAAQSTAVGGGCVQAESPTETTTTHIKGVPLVEHDYQPLSYESKSPPSIQASLTGRAREGKGEERMIC